jgi:lysozyme family protein
MPISLKDALVFTLKWEGGYTNHPLDPGGATNYGIIQVRYDQYRRDNGLSKHPVKNITVAEYTEIYDKYYWDPVRAQYVEGTLGLTLFDTAVNLGVGGCISRLQASLKVPVTGSWTQAISDKIHSSDQYEVALNICRLRIAKRYDRVKKKPSQVVFLKGWLNRDNSLIKKVKSLAGVTAQAVDDLSYDFDVDEIENMFDKELLDEIDQYDED